LTPIASDALRLSLLCCRSWTVAMLHWLAFLPTYLVACNSAQRCSSSIAGLRRSARITDTLASFHWLRALPAN